MLRKLFPLKVLHVQVHFPIFPERLQRLAVKLDSLKSQKYSAIAISLNGKEESPEAAIAIYEGILGASQRERIPVFSFLEEEATALTYLASTCGIIYANPYCIIGDIAAPRKTYYSIAKLLKHLGVSRQRFGTPTQSLWNRLMGPSANEKAFSQQWLSSVKGSMVERIKVRRGISVETINEIGQRVMSPQAALKHKLIDHIGTYEDFIAANYPNHGIDVQLHSVSSSATPLTIKETDIFLELGKLIHAPTLYEGCQQTLITSTIELIESRLEDPAGLMVIEKTVQAILGNQQRSAALMSQPFLEARWQGPQ